MHLKQRTDLRYSGEELWGKQRGRDGRLAMSASVVKMAPMDDTGPNQTKQQLAGPY